MCEDIVRQCLAIIIHINMRAFDRLFFLGNARSSTTILCYSHIFVGDVLLELTLRLIYISIKKIEVRQIDDNAAYPKLLPINTQSQNSSSKMHLSACFRRIPSLYYPLYPHNIFVMSFFYSPQFSLSSPHRVPLGALVCNNHGSTSTTASRHSLVILTPSSITMAGSSKLPISLSTL